MSTPTESWEQRAEAFVRGLSEVDQAGDMLAVERARAKRWRMGAEHFRLKMKSEQQAAQCWRDLYYTADADHAADIRALVQARRERDEARARVAELERENAGMALHMETAADRLDEASWTIAGHMAELARERDDARRALALRISRDGGAVRYGLD